MAIVIGVGSQKGGVGKSTIARLIAAEYARNNWEVKIADLDLSQGTSYHWHERRLQAGVEPEIAVEQFSRVPQALRVSDSYDLLVFDGKPHASTQPLEVARSSQLMILPTGIALDDLEPTVRLAHEFKQKGIPEIKIAIAFCRVGDSEVELNEAAEYIQNAGYFLLSGFLPERTGYRRASDMGRAAIETTHPTLNKKADELIQSIVNRMEEIT